MKPDSSALKMELVRLAVHVNNQFDEKKSNKLLAKTFMLVRFRISAGLVTVRAQAWRQRNR
jgi:hypothetical protein